MRHRSSLCLLPLFILSASLLAAPPQPEGSVPFKLKGHRIIVDGTVKGSNPLELLIDTGSSYSFVDQRVAQKLDLKSFPIKHKVNSFGNGRKTTRLVSLPSLRVGPVLTTLPCFVADLSSYGVDGILGMNLLARASFTIDFVTRQIRFGSREPFQFFTAFQKNRSGMVVTLEVDGYPTALLLDTGTNGLFLFQDRVAKWIKKYPVVERVRVSCLEGNLPASVINLTKIRMGQSQWRHRKAVVQPRFNGLDADGSLGLVPLALRRIHFDFDNNVVSWES